MEDHWVKTNTVQEAQAESQFVNLVQNGASNLDDSELCWLGDI